MFGWGGGDEWCWGLEGRWHSLADSVPGEMAWSLCLVGLPFGGVGKEN